MRLERVLTDFGCEHSFLHAAARVREHYGFEISASAVRESTLKHAQRAHQVLEKQYQQPFRILPSAGAQHVAAEADGAVICTMAPGKGKHSRPRAGKEISMTADRAQDKTAAS